MTVSEFSRAELVCVAAAQRFGTERLQAGLRGLVAAAVAAERAPRPGERPAVVTGLLRAS